MTFLFLFLPIVLGGYFLLPQKAKNIWLLISSLFFYFYGEPKYLFLMLAVITASYVFGLITDRLQGRARKISLAVSVAVILSALLFFKYTDFFISRVNSVFKSDLGLLGLALPIGISFYTFQAISYNIDVYRGDAPVQKNIIHLALYISLFPQLVAGPIVRYTDVERDLRTRRHTAEGFSYGIRRFAVGLGKKILLANSFGSLCETFRASDEKSTLFFWIYAVAFSLQVYFDFSGYSDMAIGLGRIMGFTFPENFRHPFASKSVTEFWRRWHISLGAWLKDYLFYPVAASTTAKKLGKRLRKMSGRYVGKLAVAALALTPVWLFNGLWHGAEWNYIFYGIYYLVLLLLELALEPVKAGFYRRTGIRQNGRGATLLRTLRTWVIIFTGEMFFRAPGLRAGFCMFRSLFHGFGISRLWDGTLLTFGLGMADWTAIIGGTAVVFLYDLLRERGFSIRDWVFKETLNNHPSISTVT